MKPNHPRTAQIPANFIFIGQGGAFNPSYKEPYYFVEGKYTASASFYSTREDYANDCSDADYYVKKNGPTHRLNTPVLENKPVLKKSKYTLKKDLYWSIYEGDKLFGVFNGRANARKVLNALKLAEN
jgi:hypothetical protein